MMVAPAVASIALVEAPPDVLVSVVIVVVVVSVVVVVVVVVLPEPT